MKTRKGLLLSIGILTGLLLAGADIAYGQSGSGVRMGSVMLPSEFLNHVMKLAKADGGALVFIDAEKNIIIAEVSGKQFNASFFSQKPFIVASKWAIARGEPLLMEGGSTNIPEGLLPISDNLSSFLCFPIRSGSKVVGAINLVRMFGKEAFVNTDFDLVSELAMQSKELIDKVRQKNIHDEVMRTEAASSTWIYFAPDNLIIREKSVSFEIGLNMLPARMPVYYSTDTIANVGLAMGLMMPIRIPRGLLWYRVKALVHGAKSTNGFNRNYLSALNEIIGGKPVRIKRYPFEITPLLGLGFNNGIEVANLFQGGFQGGWTHYYWNFDLGLLVRHQLHLFGADFSQGVMFNFERAFVYSDPAFGKDGNPKLRYNLTMVLSY